MQCYFNGQIIPQADASLQLNDLALLRGFGIFDYFVFQRFQARFLEDYLDRFFRSASHLGLQCPVDRDGLRRGIHQLIAANEVPEGGIRMVLTGGYTPDGFTPVAGNLFLLQAKFPTYPEQMFTAGSRVATYQHQRELPTVKSLNYLTGIYLLPWLRENNADFVVYHDGKHLRESDRSNFFIVDNNGTLITPKEKVLAGITRMKILDIARDSGIIVEEREVKLEELQDAAEAFLTSSTKGALPVTVIDGKAVGNGQVGAITKQLQAAFLALVNRELQPA
ncbi:MAG: aminotransferase class IV [Bacteroidota bacterium]